MNKRAFFVLLVSFIFCFKVLANTDNRNWELADGKKFVAALLKYNAEKKVVTLKKASGAVVAIPYDELGLVDQAWMKKFQNLQANTAALIKELGGKYEARTCRGASFETAYYVYYPSSYQDDQNIPLMLLFHPGGQGQRFLMRHILAAERAGIVIACPDIFRNSGNEKFNEELDLRFRDLHADIFFNIEFDRKKFSMGGSSGGGLRAYHFAAEFAKECFGVYSNGGWLGNRYDLPYPAMRVVITNGHKDKAANNYVSRDSKDLIKKGSTVRLFSFEGGHQTAPTETQFKSFTWIFEESMYYRGFTNDLEALRKTFKFTGDKTTYSAKGVHEVAFRVFSKVDFVGMPKEKVLMLLGNPASLNAHALVAEKELNSPLVYFFVDGETSSSWILTFTDGKVDNLTQGPSF
ncbi:MAG: hypothetical protein NE330_06185 [Lentisphaeraceae bacterium]|nr:hypothetical protein [Lentisphaeraceae bacterium]